jgi:hypothetical protein
MKGKCFKVPVFNGVVSGQVTQFREIISDNKLDFAIKSHGIDNIEIVLPKIEEYIKKSDYGNVFGIKNKDKPFRYYYDCIKPRFKVGETVYLKEPYIDEENDWVGNLLQSYLGRKPQESRMRSATQMPERLAKHFIEITGVKAERLQDISDENCIKAGIYRRQITTGSYMNPAIYLYYMQKSDADYGIRCFDFPSEAYAAFINTTHGKGTWESNPFVWVYDFKLIKT